MFWGRVEIILHIFLMSSPPAGKAPIISRTYPSHMILWNELEGMLKQCVHRSCTQAALRVTLFSFLIATQSKRGLVFRRPSTMMKVLRPSEQCAVVDGKPCAACAEDIELEKEKKELEIRIKKIDLRRRSLRTVMNENHDRLIPRFPLEIASHIFIQYAPTQCVI